MFNINRQADGLTDINKTDSQNGSFILISLPSACHFYQTFLAECFLLIILCVGREF